MAQYHLARDGKQVGVFQDQEISAGLHAGRFLPDDVLWTEGMAEWQPLSAIFGGTPGTATTGMTASAPAFNPYAAPRANLDPSRLIAPVDLATLGQRLAAALLDGLIMAAVAVGPFLAVETVSPQAMQKSELPAILILVGFAAIAVINLVFLTTRGQTLGKRIIGIRIVTYPDAQHAGFVKAVLLRAFVNGLIGAIPFVGFVYGIVDILSIFRSDRRCYHDQLAGTQVIQGQPPQS